MAQEKMFTIGQSMRNARKKAKIKQGELAKIVGYGQNAICRWENDKQTPLITAVIDVADALGVSIDELVGRDAIKILLAADVVEVKHGEWEEIDNLVIEHSLPTVKGKTWRCSICGEARKKRTAPDMNYCPNCGAKMDLKEGAESDL